MVFIFLGDYKVNMYSFRSLSANLGGFLIVISIRILSLGGLPPLMGFMSKLIGLRVLKGYSGVLVILVIRSLVALLYYLYIVFIIFIRIAGRKSGGHE